MAHEGESQVLKENKEDTDWSKVPFWTSQRFLTAIVTFWGFAVLYLQRVNLSIAMVCMIKTENKTLDGNFSFLSNESANIITTPSPVIGDSNYCDSLGLKSTTDNTGEFTWSKELQGLLLGSFFWGYLVLQVPGGMLSERYGPRRVVMYTMMPAAVLGLISPVSARVSPYFFLVIRVLIGVGESALYPAAQALFARWSPPSERSRLVGVSLSGGQFGNALIFPIGGLLCSSLGWDSVFYVMGAIGFVWCILWYVLVYDSPSLSRRISSAERGYIQHHVLFRDGQKPQPMPWKSIFKSLPFWAILVGHTCGNYGLYMLLTQIPTYMKEVLKFDLKSNGAFSMLPYLSMWLFITIAGVTSDLLITRNILSRVATRKVMSAIGLFGPAICLVGVTFMDCTQQIGAVVLLCGTVGLSGVAFAGYMVNHGDIAPQFAGTLFGITNVAATIPGILAPYIVGAITTNKTREEWQIAFFIAAAIYVFGGIFYVVFAKTTLEKWAKSPPTKEQDADLQESHHMIDIGNKI
ncbi:sialin-like [Physella acuta]|uniref:sialin-like n=1 Tax=Physella acuta TaxID=109671 RepID=UPI0027DC0599|nr:sialin-like [Physella acuta]XP_059142431.1 sialin-like [Physella acuta]XP_059142432.1 sialin-like [Physella acuta]